MNRLRLRYDGPLVLDMPNSPVAWTVIDPTHPSFRSTLGRESLLSQGFTEKDLQDAMNQWGIK